MLVSCHQGEINITRGLQWCDADGAAWEVVRPVSRIMGHGANGTPTFACVHVSGPSTCHDLAEQDGTVLMCGDSIALAVLAEQVPPWLPMPAAPTDGTEVWLLVQHPNHRRAQPADRWQWMNIARGRWTDAKRGTWQWAGLSGTPLGWRVMAAR